MPTQDSTGVKPGTRTTEFYVHGAVGAAAMHVAHVSTNPWVQGAAMLLAGACAVDYRIGRSGAKRATIVRRYARDGGVTAMVTDIGGHGQAGVAAVQEVEKGGAQ